MRTILALDNRIVSEAFSAANYFLSQVNPEKCNFLLAEKLQPIYAQVYEVHTTYFSSSDATFNLGSTRFHLFGSLPTHLLSVESERSDE